MQEWMTEFVNQFGYAGVFLLIAVETIFPPIPSEVILTFSGFLTTYTSMILLGVVATATAGSLAGYSAVRYRQLAPSRPPQALDQRQSG